MARIHALIVNYRSSSHLDNLLTSLRQVRLASCSVWDNASGGDEAGRLGRLRVDFPEVAFHFAGVNSGFGGGINRLVETLAGGSRCLVEDGDYFWILNPDVVVTVDAYEALDAVATTGQADIVSPVITTGVNDAIWYAGGDIDLLRGRISFWERPAPSRGFLSCSFVTGAAMVVSARAFAALGGFREDLFLYWEDTDLCLRAQAAGFVTGVHAGAQVWHHVGGSGGSRSEGAKSVAFFYYFTRNRLRICATGGARVSVAFGKGLPHTARPILWAARQREGRLRKAWAVLSGTVAGLWPAPAPRVRAS